MKQLVAFIQKEWLEQIRSGKLFMVVIIFTLFGIMNPAMAKLTPWMMEIASESLADSGIVVTEITVDAMTSWTQYYKNITMPLIVFLLMFSGILTVEYQKKTLINMVTKGLSRWKIILSKTSTLLLLWTLVYWLHYGVTYGYNAYFWDNGIAKNIGFAAFCIYILGVWLLSLVLFVSVLASSSAGVLLGTAAVFGICYFIGMLTKIKEYLPTQLMNAGELLGGIGNIDGYYWAIVVCMVWAVLNIGGAVLLFNRKNF
ncbi:MAG: ABC transporter permease subunit [Lachnospiraceae bacterium]|nr:ABC transporter permease subunit [Lachnospiraceae bacterium]